MRINPMPFGFQFFEKMAGNFEAKQERTAEGFPKVFRPVIVYGAETGAARRKEGGKLI